jgi:putative flippase GtrA
MVDETTQKQTSLPRIEAYRAAKFTAGAIFAFLIDISLFWFIFRILGWDYIAATIFAFLIACIVEYFFDRKYTYPEAKTPIKKGYMHYMHTACIGLVAIAIFMWIGVDVMHFEEVRTRILIGLIVGIWNYLWNRKFTFNIPLALTESTEKKA